MRPILKLAAALLLPAALWAQPPASPEPSEAGPAKKEAVRLEDKLVTTKHKAVIGGSSIAYTATAGTLVLRDEEGKPRASMFFVAYTRDGVEDRGQRPVTFTFNGGPGSSSVWLHLGAFGPRRVAMDDEGRRPAALPPGRQRRVAARRHRPGLHRPGQHRLQPAGARGEGEGVPRRREDVESVGDFIRLYTTRYRRWSSPKFLAGESYGTTRAAGLVNYLQERHGMYLNGVMLVSSILNFQTARFETATTCPIRCSCRPTRRPPGTTRGCRRSCRATCAGRSRRRSASPSASTRSP